jgi:hypothetical protein
MGGGHQAGKDPTRVEPELIAHDQRRGINQNQHYANPMDA